MSDELQNPVIVAKADAGDFLGRFREIVSDPLNLLIRRHPQAGCVQDGLVTLHNGIRVPNDGPQAYYGTFSYILTINRGVHEPLEEYVFQELLEVLPPAPAMLELGAYWGHYSMWLKKARPQASVLLVEPHEGNINTGKSNFSINQLTGEFVQAFVGAGHLEVDAFLQEKGIPRLDILHADIQSFEVEMLRGSTRALQQRAIDYWFISTHTQELHYQVVEELQKHGYRVEISADFDLETTSYDGFIFASSPEKPSVFGGFKPLGRTEICAAAPQKVVDSISQRLQGKLEPR